MEKKDDSSNKEEGDVPRRSDAAVPRLGVAVPNPDDLRTSPFSEFMKFALEELNERYKKDEQNKVQIPIPEACRCEPDVILKVSRKLALGGWDVMILGSFKLGDVPTVDIRTTRNNLDSAEFLVVTPTVYELKTGEKRGIIIPNETNWNIIDGELKYNSKHVVLNELEMKAKHNSGTCSLF